jgi:hypothetical protein
LVLQAASAAVAVGIAGVLAVLGVDAAAAGVLVALGVELLLLLLLLPQPATNAPLRTKTAPSEHSLFIISPPPGRFCPVRDRRWPAVP